MDDLTIPEDIKKYLTYIIQSVKKAIPINTIYLFGSYANGTFNEHSDLDIYIITPDTSKRIREHIITSSLAIGNDRFMPIDILVGYQDDFDRKCKIKNLVEHEIYHKGVILYDNK